MTTPTFSVNERVLCYHGPLIYEAKILKVEHLDEERTPTGRPGPHYQVHYKGWKQTWDEWVPPERVLKYNEPNIAQQKKVAAAHRPAPAPTAKAVPIKEGALSARPEGREGARTRKEPRGHKRAREEDEATRKPDLKLNVPEILKLVLVDDWEAVTKNHQLVTLPRDPTVQDLLRQWKEHIDTTEPKPQHPEAVPVIISGLQLYFDRSLGAQMLYRFERVQYAEIRRRYITGPKVKVGEEKEMSAIYGAEHFLRMLVSLPTMIAASSMDPESVLVVRDFVHLLFDWMVQEKGRIFQQDYESTTTQYQSLSRT